MRPHHNQFRDPQTIRAPRYASMIGPRSYGRYPHHSESRPPNTYPGRYYQTASFQPKGPSVPAPKNVSTHSTVRWLNSNQPSNKIRVYSRPKILTPVSIQSRASSYDEFQRKSRPSTSKSTVDKAENKSNTAKSRTYNQSSDSGFDESSISDKSMNVTGGLDETSSSAQRSISGSLSSEKSISGSLSSSQKQVKSDMIDIAQLSELVEIDSKPTDTNEKTDNSTLNITKEDVKDNTDAVDGPHTSSSSGATFFSSPLPSPPWLKPKNTPQTEQQSIDENSMVVDTSTELENVSMQGIETEMDTSCNSTEQKTNPADETMTPGSQSSMVLEELQSSNQSERTNRTEERRNRYFPIQKRGKNWMKNRRRNHYRKLRSMERSIDRISISDFTIPTSSSNIYTNYEISQQSRQHQGYNYNSSYWHPPSHGSSHSQPVQQQSSFNPGNLWNSLMSLPSVRMPTPLNTGPRPRLLSYPQQPSSFQSNNEKYPILEKLQALKRKRQ